MIEKAKHKMIATTSEPRNAPVVRTSCELSFSFSRSSRGLAHCDATLISEIARSKRGKRETDLDMQNEIVVTVPVELIDRRLRIALVCVYVACPANRAGQQAEERKQVSEEEL